MELRWTKIVTVVVLCLIWFGVSSMSNIIGKRVLNSFPYPMTLTFSQLLSSTMYSVPLLYCHQLSVNSIPKSYFIRLVLPLALGKCLASLSSHISIWKVPVSYAHTVKATLPLFTVVFTRVLFGEKQKLPVHLSLIPIIAGVAIATVTELAFDVVGLIAALTATAGFSLQNIFSKKLMKGTGAHSFVVVSLLARLSMLIFLPFWLGFDVRGILANQCSVEGLEVDWWNIAMLLMLDGLLNFSQNLLAFAFLSMVTPLTYAVASAAKRLTIIGLSILLMRNEVTPANVVGIVLAVGGVLLYTWAKHSSKSSKSVRVGLVHSDTSSLSSPAIISTIPSNNNCSLKPTTKTHTITAPRHSRILDLESHALLPSIVVTPSLAAILGAVTHHTSVKLDSPLVTPRDVQTTSPQGPDLSDIFEQDSEESNVVETTVPVASPHEPDKVIPTFRTSCAPISPSTCAHNNQQRNHDFEKKTTPDCVIRSKSV